MWIDVKDKEYICRNYADQDLAILKILIIVYIEKVSVHAFLFMHQNQNSSLT